MNRHNFNSEECARVRRHLDAYLNNELLVETTSEVLRHLESCEACSRELEARTRLRDALRRAASNQLVPEELSQSIQNKIRARQPGLMGGLPRLSWALASVVVLVVAGIVAQQWLSIERGRRVVASVLAIGVADHVQCAIKGHNYPEVANPPEVLRKKLGPRYAGLLDVVQGKLPGFEVLEAHICSIPGSSRKYIHFITRGRGTILSVVMTRADGAQFPRGTLIRSANSEGVNLYEDRVDGMNAAGFEADGYLGFVVSDLDPGTIVQIAKALAPAVQGVLEAGKNSAYLLPPEGFADRAPVICRPGSSPVNSAAN
jgi:anti-sigma factor (TIGR02949 family)